MLDKDHVAEIVERNPRVDASAVERSRRLAEKLAELGIESGGYRLEPALGGRILRDEQRQSRVRSQLHDKGKAK
jgi:hypothetical protein